MSIKRIENIESISESFPRRPWKKTERSLSNYKTTEKFFNDTCTTVPKEPLDTIWWTKLDDSIVARLFEETAIRPKNIEIALNGRSNRSSTGPNGTEYGVFLLQCTIKSWKERIHQRHGELAKQFSCRNKTMMKIRPIMVQSRIQAMLVKCCIPYWTEGLWC